MQIDLLISSVGNIAVFGSNGFIGSHICLEVTNYLRTNQVPFHHWSEIVPSDRYATSYFKTVIHQQLISRSSCQQNLESLIFIFSFGSGGFSLDEVSAHQQYKEFSIFLAKCYQVYPHIRALYISSLGAMSSILDTPYKFLSQSIESNLLMQKGNCVIRLPGIWGLSQFSSGQALTRGIVGHLLDANSLYKPVIIYAEMFTSRYYLNVRTAATEVLKLTILSLDNHLKASMLNLVPLLKLDINSLIAHVSRISDVPVAFTIKPGAIADCESHLLANMDGLNLYVQESFDFRTLVCPSYP